MKTILLTESSFNRLILLENREDKNINLARRYLKTIGYNQEDANKIVDSIRTDIPNSRIAKCKFLVGVARMYADGQLNNGSVISRLNSTLKYVGSNAHVDEYDNNLNNESANDIINRFSTSIENDIKNDKIELNKGNYILNNDYIIKQINSFNEAKEYSKYTNWCVTHYEEMYNSYTNEGMKPFYFCLKKGFENIKPNPTINTPLDEYGLSMIAISVNEDGSLNTCTCRWNHDNNGNDNIMNTKEISNLFGVNFYDLFKPYSKEYIEKKIKEKDDIFEQKLKQFNEGANIDNVFPYNECINLNIYYISNSDEAEYGVIMFKTQNQTYDFLRNKNNNIIYYKRFYKLTNNICGFIENNGKSGLIQTPEMKIIRTFQNNTEAYLLLTNNSSTFKSQILYIYYPNRKIKFIDLYNQNKETDFIDNPWSIKQIDNDILQINYLNKEPKFFNLVTFEIYDKLDKKLNIVETFKSNSYDLAIVKNNEKYNLYNHNDNTMYYENDVENIIIKPELNLLIVYHTLNDISFLKLNTFNGYKFKSYFLFRIKDYSVDSTYDYIYHIKLSNKTSFDFNFKTNTMYETK